MEERELLIGQVLLAAFRPLVKRFARERKDTADLLERLRALFVPGQDGSGATESAVREAMALSGLDCDGELVSLTPLLATLSLENQQGHATTLRFSSRPLTANTSVLLPREGESGDPRMGEILHQQLQQALACAADDPGKALAVMFRMLEKNGWCLALAGQQAIPLYHLAQSAVALAVCLHEAAQAQHPLLFVSGDVSGIQSFIYQVSAADALRGTAKRLRGRSFYVSLLCDLVPRYLLRRLGLLPVQMLFSGGGRFLLVVPNCAGAGDKLQQAWHEVEAWLAHEFEGELRLAMAWKCAGREAVAGFAAFREDLEELLTQQEQRPFAGLLDRGEAMFPSRVQHQAKRLCRSCRLAVVRESERPEEEICQVCRHCQVLGDQFPKIEALAFLAAEAATDAAHVPFGVLGKVAFGEKDSDLLRGCHGWADFHWINNPQELLSEFLPTHVACATARFDYRSEDSEETVYPGQILPFDVLARMALGDRKLGFLKMDVDHLGLLFASGGSGKLPGTVTLSRQLDYFFKGLINDICARQAEEWHQSARTAFADSDKVNSCFYVSYAGGDDLLIIGPASEMPRLALRIRNEFDAYCGRNPDVTISAGLFFCRSKYPIARAAEEANEAIDASKGGGRNRITLFGYTLPWADCDMALRMGDTIGGYLRHGLSKNFVRQVLQIRQNHDKSPEKQHNHVPLLVYQIARNVDDDEQKRFFMEHLITRVDAPQVFEYIGVALNYALLKTRKEY